MKIAVLCLAHSGNASGVKRIARYFSGMNATVFVHVDARANLQPYKEGAISLGYMLASNRYPVYWGGFSFLLAIVSLIRDALEQATFDKFMLVSEDSIPLVTCRRMEESLRSSIEWIDLKEATQEWIIRRYREFYSFDSPATCPRSPPVEQRVFSSDFAKSVGRMELLFQQGKTPLQHLYHGSAWWTLSAAKVIRMLEIHGSDTRLRESFEFSANPDEQYMQTLYSMVSDTEATQSFMENDFNRSPKPYVYEDVQEIEALRRRVPTLFLRKVPLESKIIDGFVENLRLGSLADDEGLRSTKI